MIRRSGAGRLHDLADDYEREEDVNPMEGTSSMSDAMLVLAVGMMLAVVINWNVDINKNTMKQIEDPQDVSSDQITDQGAEQNLEEKGTVYYDAEKDQYYVKVDE